MASVRTFVAVQLDSETRAALATAADALRAPAAGLSVSWVAPENYHLTMTFLGGVDETRLAGVIDAVHAAARGHVPFEIDVVGLGAFPSPARARVLWAGLRGGTDALASLAGAMDDAVARLGFPREERAFSPHVTLARIREPRRAPALADALAAAATQPFGRVAVREATVMRSDLSPRGARYMRLAGGLLGR